ncbi:hypothetical protein PR048_006826 [Dryococelus australis]|uniref:PiggyBac transposable element-derived protein domain-containing protein n=1 Tax=Dryococelus australis TaxID=614101 RepID=A0ABQ9ID06_9NEOP|nr:hypothetical protein PR048_006826 [Dryococelus australis]
MSDDEGSQSSDLSTENSDHRTDSEISASSSENEDESSTDNDLQFRHNKNVLLARNNYKWSKIPPSASRTRAHNLVTKLPGLAVISLFEPIVNSDRNITADNWFSSIGLVEQLKLKGLTYVGTVRKNTRDIPLHSCPKDTGNFIQQNRVH